MGATTWNRVGVGLLRDLERMSNDAPRGCHTCKAKGRQTMRFATSSRLPTSNEIGRYWWKSREVPIRRYQPADAMLGADRRDLCVERKIPFDACRLDSARWG